MTQPNAEPFIVSGIIQRPLVPSSAPIRCVLATTGRDVAKAQRFWIHRYRQAGLLGFSNGDQSAHVTDQTQADHERSDGTVPMRFQNQWNSMTFMAFQTCRWSLTPHPKSAVARQRGVGLHDGEQGCAEVLCGTVTLLSPRLGSPAGAPHGRVSSSESRERIGRITRLAIDHAGTGQDAASKGYRSVFLELTSHLHRYALGIGLTHLDAIVHPRHAKLYRRVFNAQAIGDPFPCDEVCGSPGQYMRADITRANQFHSRLRDRFQFRTSAGGYSSSSKLSQT